MATRVALLAALPRELAGLRGAVKADRALERTGVYLYEGRDVVFAAAGMGAQRVTLAFEAALRSGKVDEVISVGLAGACVPELEAGTALEAGTVVDTRTGERWRTAMEEAGPVLASAPSIAGVREKMRLAAAYGAVAVEMEAATVARLAAAHGIRFRAVKGISDAHDVELESLARFAGPQGQFRTAAFALHTALRPGTWARVAALGRDSKRALAAMRELLAER